ncbi:hypothetical protein CJ739_91 [Mariniflexile rhizosphaerae]|uniref:hypothetical protein n=1 Tax=unclassified Mariniflexile TaxID=2643887 RepID=UPI000E333C1C|nr:hypothetical protein [Mariniflexile sp. TRM1-10]AXP79191.1 hypothetical protein CJ739_91 [Mariniflexile sp. TRM1-10]
MEETISKFWYQTLDWSMIWVCLGSVVALLLYMGAYGTKEIVQGKSGEIIRNKWVKPFYHLVSAFVVLAMIKEIGFDSIKSFIGLSLDAEGKTIHTLAVISGLGGGYILSKLIRFFQKLK